MLLLPKTPPLTYPNMKRFKDQKKHHFFFTFTFTFTSLHFTIKESFKVKYSTCKTSVGVNFYKGNPFEIFPSASIFQRNPLKNFFHLIFFPREISCKKFKFHLQFYVKIFLKKFSSFFTGKSLVKFFQKITFETIFEKIIVAF